MARGLLPAAGMLVPPLVWAVSTQAGQILPYPECAGSFHYSLALSATAALVSLGSAWLSWHNIAWDGKEPSESLSFVARIGAMMGVIFAVALIFQAMAGVVLSGCER